MQSYFQTTINPISLKLWCGNNEFTNCVDLINFHQSNPRDKFVTLRMRVVNKSFNDLLRSVMPSQFARYGKKFKLHFENHHKDNIWKLCYNPTTTESINTGINSLHVATIFIIAPKSSTNYQGGEFVVINDNVRHIFDPLDNEWLVIGLAIGTSYEIKPVIGDQIIFRQFYCIKQKINDTYSISTIPLNSETDVPIDKEKIQTSKQTLESILSDLINQRNQLQERIDIVEKNISDLAKDLVIYNYESTYNQIDFKETKCYVIVLEKYYPDSNPNNLTGEDRRLYSELLDRYPDYLITVHSETICHHIHDNCYDLDEPVCQYSRFEPTYLNHEIEKLQCENCTVIYQDKYSDAPPGNLKSTYRVEPRISGFEIELTYIRLISD
jgi:hypothetical protein